MIPGDALLDAFLDANILIVVAFALWSVVRFCLQHLGLRHSYRTQLKLLNSTFVIIVLSPFIVLFFHTLQGTSVARALDVNLSDIAVSYFLNGGIEMKATEFERLLLTRDTFTSNVMSASGFVAWLAIAAFAGALAYGVGRLAFALFCLRKIVANSYHLRGMGRVRIRVSDRILVPFSTRGLWRYHVVIPSHMLGMGDELRVSLAHEFQHIRQGDVEWEIVLEALKPLFFLNPAYHAWKRHVEALRELSCDSEVLARGRIGVREYCDTLLSVCQQTLRQDRVFVLALPKVALVTADRFAIRDGRKSFLEQRITSLLDKPKLNHPHLIYALIGVPLMAATVLTAITIQSPKDWSQDRLMLSTVVNLERLDEINRLSTFGTVRN